MANKIHCPITWAYLSVWNSSHNTMRLPNRKKTFSFSFLVNKIREHKVQPVSFSALVIDWLTMPFLSCILYAHAEYKHTIIALYSHLLLVLQPSQQYRRYSVVWQRRHCHYSSRISKHYYGLHGMAGRAGWALARSVLTLRAPAPIQLNVERIWNDVGAVSWLAPPHAASSTAIQDCHFNGIFLTFFLSFRDIVASRRRVWQPTDCADMNHCTLWRWMKCYSCHNA